MKFTVVGAGAIGGTVGAYMARAGDQIEFVDVVADHVAAMKEKGLTIQAYNDTFTVPVVAHHPEELTGPLDIVLLAVKSQHTEAAVQSIRPLLGPESAIVSLQNGLCESTIAKLVGPERTIGAFIDLFADYLEPGVIQYGGPGTVRVGELDGTISPRVEEIVRHVRHWGPVEATANVQGYLWSKLGFTNMLFATTLADETMADVIARYPDLMVDLASEVYEVADQEGVRLEPFDNVEPHLYYPREQRDWQVIRNNLADLEAWLRGNQKVKSGVWRDLAVRKRKTEVDQQIGLAAEIGRRHGLRMVLTRKLVSMIHELEEGRRPMQWANLDELEQMRIRATMAAGSSGHA
jgi:2-dehydropantoate 2-reductase